MLRGLMVCEMPRRCEKALSQKMLSITISEIILGGDGRRE
jgi:hypothetical protein